MTTDAPRILRAIATMHRARVPFDADVAQAEQALLGVDISHFLDTVAQAIETWSKVPKKSFTVNGVKVRGHYIRVEGSRVTFFTRISDGDPRAAMAAKYGLPIGNVTARPFPDDPQEWEIVLGGGLVEEHDA